MWKHRYIFSNASSRFAKFRKLVWGANGIRGGGIAPCPPSGYGPAVGVEVYFSTSILVIRECFMFIYL